MKSIVKLQKNREELFINLYYELKNSTQLENMKEYVQHGETSCLEHSIAVAYYSYYLVQLLHIRCDERSLIRGALLHDYFLYDWHEKDKSHSLHGFNHAARSLNNARRDTDINEIEADMIKHHMFPLNISPPRTREAIILCLMDKICSIYELRRKKRYSMLYELLLI
ncbi:MAG: HD domain-containing protein [bacterium]|nr:HD domain-containing protein [bacterium]